MKCGRHSRGSGYFLVSLVLAAAAWFIVLVTQALLTSSAGHDAVGVLWFATIVQFFVNVGVTRRVFYGGTCPHQQQIANFASISVVLGVIGVDKTVYSNDQRQQVTAAGWIILSAIDILWVFHFSIDTGASTDISRGFPGEEQPLSAGSRSSSSQPHTASTSNQSDPPSDTMVEKHASPLPPPPPTSTSTDNSKDEHSVLSPSHTSGATPSDARHPSRAYSYLTRPSSTTPSDLNHPSSLLTVAESLQSGTTTAPEYSRRAQAIWTYQAADPEELSFTADEILYVTTAPQEKWWEARKMDGSKGMVPSNFLSVLPS